MPLQTSVDGNGRGCFRRTLIMGCWYYGFKTYVKNNRSLQTSRLMVAGNCALTVAATASGPQNVYKNRAVRPAVTSPNRSVTA